MYKLFSMLVFSKEHIHLHLGIVKKLKSGISLDSFHLIDSNFVALVSRQN